MLLIRTLRNIASHRSRSATTLALANRVLVLLTLALVALITPTLGYASSHDPLIKRVEVDETTNRMKVIGVNFGGGEVTVTLEGNDLHVITCNSIEILVYLPAGITPGTYLLKVSIGNRNKEDTFNVAVGAQGPQGEPGPQGAQGPRGATGARGPQGDIGPVGPRGPQGNAGPAGPQGPRGANGATGATGAQGTIGNSGPVGPQGPSGADGAAGAPGAKGMNYKDLYDPAVNYLVDDVVSHGGSSFIAKTPNTGVEPIVGPNWGLVAQKGDIGAAGALGPEGPRGLQGPSGQGLSSFESLEGLTCRGDTGRTSIIYATNGDATLRCILNALPPGTLPSLSINDVSQRESQTLAFTVALSAPSYQTVTVQFATEDASAVAGSDYVSLAGATTFLPGEITKTISVASLADGTEESDETFKVNLTNAVNSNIGDAQGVGTIRNAEPSSISISNTSCEETHPCHFTVTRTGDTSSTATVNYATQNGSAREGSDFLRTVGTLTFTPGQVTLIISVITFDDGEPPIFGGDDDETFTMVLSNPSAGVTITGTGRGTGTIRP